MSFERIKTIKGRGYRYGQTNVREGKRVRSVMEYLGPVGGHRPGIASAERQPSRWMLFKRRLPVKEERARLPERRDQK
jgi:hypothetical protein